MVSIKHLLLLLLFISAFALHAQTPNAIDIEIVRNDLLSKPHLSPDDFIKNLEPAMFKVMYAGTLCFVHLPYKSPSGETFKQSSDMIVYRLSENKWTFENLIPAWFDITLLDPANLVFFADVKFCEANGACQTYESVSYYDGKQLFILREYKGFDKTLYFQELNNTGNPGKIKFAVGDAISKTFTLTNFQFEKHQLSFTLTLKAEAIEYISRNGIRKKVTQENFERVIANL